LPDHAVVCPATATGRRMANNAAGRAERTIEFKAFPNVKFRLVDDNCHA
jgi:hypothetical protein